MSNDRPSTESFSESTNSIQSQKISFDVGSVRSVLAFFFLRPLCGSAVSRQFSEPAILNRLANLSLVCNKVDAFSNLILLHFRNIHIACFGGYFRRMEEGNIIQRPILERYQRPMSPSWSTRRPQSMTSELFANRDSDSTSPKVRILRNAMSHLYFGFLIEFIRFERLQIKNSFGRAQNERQVGMNSFMILSS
jgi:hypothetical protein